MNTPTVTPALLKRTIEALTETERVIAKEMSYPVDLRRNDWLNKMEAHKVKLQNMIACAN